MIPIAVINRDKSIWGEDATEFKLVFLILDFILVIRPAFFFFLDLSDGRIFRMLPFLSLESGRTC